MEKIFNFKIARFNISLMIISLLGIVAVLNYTNSDMVLALRNNNVLFKEIFLISGVYILFALVAYFLNRDSNIYRISFLFAFILMILTSVGFSFISHQIVLISSISFFAIPSVLLSGIIYTSFKK